MIKERKQFLREYFQLCEKHNLQIDAHDLLSITPFANNYEGWDEFIFDEITNDQIYYYHNLSHEEQLEFIKNRIK